MECRARLLRSSASVLAAFVMPWWLQRYVILQRVTNAGEPDPAYYWAAVPESRGANSNAIIGREGRPRLQRGGRRATLRGAALLSMLLLVGDIHRVELKKSLLPGAGA